MVSSSHLVVYFFACFARSPTSLGSLPVWYEVKPPAYPSSSKKHVDWSAVERAVGAEEDKPEGEQALNALFQQIFRDGTDEVKKAMMKSFVESGGTTLSTNWDEVGKAPVPIRPPDGMEPKKY